MRTKIVRIGNSQGVRIPKEVLAEAGFLNDDDTPVEVIMTVRDDGILIRPTTSLNPVEAFFEFAEAFRNETGGIDLDLPPRELGNRPMPFQDNDE